MKAVFLQARLDSSRLPRKVLLILVGKTVMEWAMTALNNTNIPLKVLLTTDDSANELSPLASSCGWDLFCGPRDDVLSRFLLAAEQYGVTRIVRATGDNPLVSASMARAALELLERKDADYAGFRDMPLGAGVEAVRVSALKQAGTEARDSYEREHVSPFLYRRPERFCIVTPPAPEPFRLPDARITLDTQEDYNYLETLFRDLSPVQPPDLPDIIPWLKEHPRHAP